MIISAERTFRRTLPRPDAVVARHGLAFERRFLKALTISSPKDLKIEHNPWFSYKDTNLSVPQACSPDIMMVDENCGFVVVFEVKLTWVPGAIDKLKRLYCPVVTLALGLPAKPVVVCKTLTPESPRPQPTITFALASPDPVIHFFGKQLRW